MERKKKIEVSMFVIRETVLYIHFVFFWGGMSKTRKKFSMIIRMNAKKKEISMIQCQLYDTESHK